MHVDAAGSINQLIDVRQPTRLLPVKSQQPVKPAQAVKPTTGLETSATAAGQPASPTCGTTMPLPSMDELMNAWGSSDAMCDLTGDGAVDVNDLLALINQMATQQPPQPAETDPALATITPEDPTTTIAVEPDPTSTVAINDPASIQAAPAADSSATTSIDAALPPTPTAVQSDPSVEPAQTPTLQGIMDNWGQSNATNDVNGDGIVNVQDLLAFLNGNSPGGAPINHARAAEAARARIALSKGAFGVNAASHSMGGVSKLTNSLIDALAAAGFQNQPPTNLHELVDKLNLGPRQNDYVMTKLQQQYPHGLGVNAIA